MAGNLIIVDRGDGHQFKIREAEFDKFKRNYPRAVEVGGNTAQPSRIAGQRGVQVRTKPIIEPAQVVSKGTKLALTALNNEELLAFATANSIAIPDTGGKRALLRAIRESGIVVERPPREITEADRDPDEDAGDDDLEDEEED